MNFDQIVDHFSWPIILHKKNTNATQQTIPTVIHIPYFLLNSIACNSLKLSTPIFFWHRLSETLSLSLVSGLLPPWVFKKMSFTCKSLREIFSPYLLSPSYLVVHLLYIYGGIVVTPDPLYSITTEDLQPSNFFAYDVLLKLLFYRECQFTLPRIRDRFESLCKASQKGHFLGRARIQTSRLFFVRLHGTLNVSSFC